MMRNDEVKRIDIHTKDQLKDNEERYSKPIDPNVIKEYVYENIEFEFPDSYWLIVNDTFEIYWNNILGIGGQFSWDEVGEYVFNEFQQRKILIEEYKIKTIVNLMLTKIENDNGFLE